MRLICALVLGACLVGGCAVGTPPSGTTAPQSAGVSGDDAEAEAFIREGFARVADLISQTQRAPDFDAMVSVYRELGTYAQSQRMVALSLQPTGCARRAFGLWGEALVLLETLADDYLAAVESGDFDDFSSSDTGRKAGMKAREATDALNSDC